jgi:hypothetical protein
VRTGSYYIRDTKGEVRRRRKKGFNFIINEREMRNDKESERITKR